MKFSRTDERKRSTKLHEAIQALLREKVFVDAMHKVEMSPSEFANLWKSNGYAVPEFYPFHQSH